MHSTKNPNTGLYEVSVDGLKYEFSKWGAEEALDVLFDISKITGKPLASAVAGMFSKDSEDKSKVSPEIIGEIIGALMDRLDKKTCMALIKKLSSEKAWCEGAKISFDTHYQDKFDHLYRVIRAALEVQYGNFFAAFQGALGIRFPSQISNRVPPT